MEKITESIVHLLEEKKAEDIKIISAKGRSPFYDDVIIVTAPNPRAAYSFSESVLDFLEEKGQETKKPEGNEESEWIVLDGGDFVLHILSEARRKELSLEELLDSKKH
ncbi:MAG TPA: ribosome silencing factor [Firmicutes bacterium]|nr:ribosome silencing factor [Bacillota bacterium]